jgi:hypothetical protein
MTSGYNPSEQSQDCHFLRHPYQLIAYTKQRSTCTSISGPGVGAKAWSLSTPNLATAMAIANLKLLPATVKHYVRTNLQPNSSFLVINAVARKMTAKCTNNSTATPETEKIRQTMCLPWEAKRARIVKIRPIRDHGLMGTRNRFSFQDGPANLRNVT